MFSENPTRERMFFLPNGNKRAICVELPMENIKKTTEERNRILIGGSYYQLHASNKQRNKSSKLHTFSDCCRLVTGVQAAAPIRHKAEQVEAGSHLTKQPIPGQEPREVGGSYKQGGLRLRDDINILHTCITQKHFFFFLCAVE